jgi:predicted nucleotidyltransferase
MGLRELFHTMVVFFSRERMDFALIGAFSLHAFGYTRATRDIDFITRIENQEKIVRYLTSLGFETIQRTTAFSNHRHPIGDSRIDFMYVDGDTAEKIFSSVQKGMVFENIELPVVSPEHLIALKLFAAHNDGERKYRELADIHEIMRRVNVDRTAVRGYFRKYGFEENYEEIAGKDQ